MDNVIEFVRRFRRKDEKPADPEIPASSPDEGLEELLNLPLDEFGRRKTALKLRSCLLDEDIFFISNPNCLQLVDSDYVAYLPEELAILVKCGPPPETIRTIHHLKKILGATLKDGVLIDEE